MMTSFTLSGTDRSTLAPASPAPSRGLREQLTVFAGMALSLAIVAVVISRIGGFDGSQLSGAPLNPWFWLCFALSYALAPAIDWTILRRIWGLRANAMPALLRKQVANEIVFGYSGEAQFYLWARRHLGLRGSVFGTLRDVSVLSALAGNLATLAMMAATAPLLIGLAGGALLDTLLASTAVIILSSFAIFALRRLFFLFSLPPRDLAITFALHCVRIALSLVLTAMLWKMLVPALPATTLVAVATLRMMVHRLPLVPARDTLLAPILLALLGPASGLAAATMLVAALTLGTHLVVGLATAITPLAIRQRATA